VETSALLDPLKALAFASARLMALFAVFSLLDSGNVKGVVRMAIVLSLALMVAPLVYGPMPAQMPMEQVLALMAKETLLGGLMGFAANQMLWVVQTVGSLVDQQTGVGTASMIDPVNNAQEGPTPGLLNTVFVNLLLASGGFLGLLGLVFDSYTLWPVFSYWPQLDQRLEWLVSAQMRSLLDMAVRIVSPVILVLLLAELGLGLAQRYLSTLNVFLISQGLKIVLGFFMLSLVLAGFWDTVLGEMNPQRAVKALWRLLGH
jgi:type III secretion protein T